MFDLGRSSQTVPVGKTVKASINTLTSEEGLTKISLLLEGRQSGPVRTRTSHMLVAQVGPYSVMQHIKEESKSLSYNVNISD
jgi:hypothetical protein